ncbi:hypothetical protein MJO29_000274 [Puccinia striiformis f. sp. tritici]|nr:hypothetical protein MJO29_000274 [Puccinia striiformis f. sp. tritici]
MTNIDPSLPSTAKNNSSSSSRTQKRNREEGEGEGEGGGGEGGEEEQLDPSLTSNGKRKRERERERESEIERENTNHLEDTIQLAHLITSIQSHHVPLEPTPTDYHYLQPQIEPEWKEKFDTLLNPLKLEISRLRSRIETLEDERLVMAREITSLKTNVIIPATTDLQPTRSLTGTTPYSRVDHPLRSINHHASDIPVGPLPEIGTSSNSSLPTTTATAMTVTTNRNLPVNPALIQTPISKPIITSSSKFETGGVGGSGFRRQSTRKKSEVSINNNSFNTPTTSSNNTNQTSNSNSNNNRSKHRKPELSRTVRATVFRLMGVSSSHSPGPSTNGGDTATSHNTLSGSENCKFGNEKSRAYHGYTTSPCFPEYTSEELIDPITKAKIWRWDWTKTIRQSTNNTNFAKEIRNVIVKEVADPIKPLHTEVPIDDWLYLDDAIDSAYTNMRRERDNLIDPNKMIKKEVHRARNKKRGLKEDKFKRRKKALDEYRFDPNSFIQKLRESELDLADKPSLGEGETIGEQTIGEQETEELNWDSAIDIKYMSSEDEANIQEFESPIPILSSSTSLDPSSSSKVENNSLAGSDKVFAICRPTWRSLQLQNLYSVLDIIKQPERAYRRVMGPNREVRAPIGTPSWMLNNQDRSSGTFNGIGIGLSNNNHDNNNNLDHNLGSDLIPNSQNLAHLNPGTDDPTQNDNHHHQQQSFV